MQERLWDGDEWVNRTRQPPLNPYVEINPRDADSHPTTQRKTSAAVWLFAVVVVGVLSLVAVPVFRSAVDGERGGPSATQAQQDAAAIAQYKFEWGIAPQHDEQIQNVIKYGPYYAQGGFERGMIDGHQALIDETMAEFYDALNSDAFRSHPAAVRLTGKLTQYLEDYFEAYEQVITGALNAGSGYQSTSDYIVGLDRRGAALTGVLFVLVCINKYPDWSDGGACSRLAS